MGKQASSDYDWSWWPGNPDDVPSSRLADEAEQEPFVEPSPAAIVPADPPRLDGASVTGRPLLRSARGRKAERQRRRARVVASILILGLVAALALVISLPDASAPLTITQSDLSGVPASPAAEIQAYIVGAVAHPGVYVLHQGDRVYKLLQAAGGALPDADLARVNLAAYVADGEEVFVPRLGQPFPSGLPGGGPGKVNINTASAEEMDALLPIGLTTASKIVAYREEHGPYTAITQLLNVMSRSTFDKIKDYVTI